MRHENTPNLPIGLIEPIKALGHHVDSIDTLGLKGISNGALYREVAIVYDICLTKDKEFARRVQDMLQFGSARVILVTLPQQPEPQFVEAFLDSFRVTDGKRREMVNRGPHPNDLTILFFLISWDWTSLFSLLSESYEIFCCKSFAVSLLWCGPKVAVVDGTEYSEQTF